MIYKVLIPLIIAIILGTEGIFTGHYFSGIPIIRLIEITMFIFLIHKFKSDLNGFLLFNFKFLGFLVLLLFLKLGVMTFYENELSLNLFQEIFTLLLYMIIIYLGYFMLKMNFKFINIILFINFIIFLIAFFQSDLTPLTEQARDLKLQYFNQNSDSEISERSLFSRLTGLYSFTLVLGYALLTSSITTLYAYIKTKSNIYFYFFIFIGIVSLLTLTRSIIISWSVLFIFILIKQWKYNNYLKKIFILAFFFGLFISSFNFVNTNINTFSRVSNLNDTSAEGKIPLLVTGIYTLIQNPIAITDNDYLKAKKEMYQIYGNPDILKFPSHNAIVNLGFKFTIFGLLGFIYFVYIIFTKYLKNINPEYHSFIKIASFSYLLNGLTHNSFIFNLDFPILFFISIIAYELHLSKTTNRYREIPIDAIKKK